MVIFDWVSYATLKIQSLWQICQRSCLQIICSTYPWILPSHLGPLPTKQLLPQVQRCAARFIFNDYSRTSSVTKMVTKLEWEQLNTRHMKALLCTIYKETHSIILSNISHLLDWQDDNQSRTRPTMRQDRGNFIYNSIHPNKNNYHFFHPWTIPEWNILPDQTKSSLTLDTFDLTRLACKAHFKV